MKFIGKACIQLNRNERVSSSKNIRIKSQLYPSRYLCIRIIDMHHLFGFQFEVDFNDCSWKFAKVFDSITIDVPNFIQKFSNKFLFDDVFCYDRSVYEFFYCDSKEFGKNVPFLTIIWQTWLFLENIEILGIEPILFYSNVIQERHIILVHNEFVLFFRLQIIWDSILLWKLNIFRLYLVFASCFDQYCKLTRQKETFLVFFLKVSISSPICTAPYTLLATLQMTHFIHHH